MAENSPRKSAQEIKLTPMMRQYRQHKERHPDAILLFRMGDFYEMFFEDARKASSILEIALTTRDKNKEESESVPMCGSCPEGVQAFRRWSRP